MRALPQNIRVYTDIFYSVARRVMCVSHVPTRIVIK